MTKITTDFVGTESTVVTKSRLTQILAYWGASTAGYTLWGQARSALNVRLLNTTAGVIGEEELAGSFLPKINFLNDPDSMILTALFGAGEQGVWFDPSDVANVAWRRNMLLYTEQFDRVSDWPRADVSVTANVATAPDGTMTADLLVESATNANHLLNKSGVLNGVTGTYTLSCYAKASTRNWFRLQSQSSIGAWVNLNLSTGAVGLSGTGITNVSVVSAGNGWYRISGAVTVSNQPVSAQLFVIDSDRGGGSPSYLGDGTSGIFIWGAQLELGTVATDYQRISDLNTEVIERFPDATMYQDFIGTIPVYAPNQPVGLRLDKSKGLVLGPELITNGDFSGGTTGWSVTGGTQAVVSGALVATPNPSGVVYSSQSFSTVVGQTYQVRGSILAGTSTFFGIRKGDGATGGANAVTLRSSVGNLVGVFTATATTSFIIMQANDSGSATFDNISVKLLPGNHATQSTDISRPLYGIEPAGGRRNLLTYTEEFSNAVWTYSNATVTANSIAAPDGSITADLVSYTGGTSIGVRQVLAASGTKSYSFYVKNASGARYFQILTDGTVSAFANFDIQAVVVGTKGASVATSQIIDAGGGWYRITMTATDASAVNVYCSLVGSATAGWSNGATSGSHYIWGAQLELNNAATPYQKVVSDYEVTEAGVQTCHYCNYDGTNDGMVTNSINFTATDKMSVFVAVRKLSDAVVGMIAELSADSNTNAGSFNFFAPLSTGSGGVNYSSGSRGSAAFSGLLRVDITGTAPAPDASVLSSINDIAGDLTTLRRNAVVAGTGTGDKGTGTFGNYPLYLGRRGGSTLPFNGRDYGIIVTGKLATSTQIGNAENFLLNKLGSLAPVITGVPTIGVN